MAAVPPSRGLTGERTDLCVANGLVTTGLGFASGAVLSLLVFKRTSTSLFARAPSHPVKRSGRPQLTEISLRPRMANLAWSRIRSRKLVC